MAELLINAPPVLIPVPFKVSVFVLAIAVPFRSNTAPLVTETVAAEAPKADVLPTFSVPLLIVVPPVKVLVPESVSVPAPDLVSVLACGVPQVLLLLLTTFAEINKSTSAVPLATLKVVPVTELPEPNITLPAPEMVDCVSPEVVTVPASAQASGPSKPAIVKPPVEVSVPPASVRLPKRLKKVPLFVIVPPALIVIGVSTLTVCTPNTSCLPKLSVPPSLTVMPALALFAIAPPVPTNNVPPLIVVVPVYVFAPVSVSTPAPCLVKVPVPEITLETVKSLLRLNINAALLVTLPEPKTPVSPPLPICKLPFEIVVVVEPLVEPANAMVFAPTLVKPKAPEILPLSV